MRMTKTEYGAYVDRLSPPTPVGKDMAMAFLFGGAVCALASLLQEGYHALGASIPDAGTLATVTLIALSALLTAFSVYDDVAKHVGAGLVVPITGFANSIVSPAMEFRSEGMVTGLAAKMFVVAGPVIVYGVASSAVYGVVLWVIRLVQEGGL